MLFLLKTPISSHKKAVCAKMGSLQATHAPKTKNFFFFSEMTKPDPKLSKPYFNKISNVLVELCFSILCNAFLLKSVTSSHNSTVIKMPWSTVV